MNTGLQEKFIELKELAFNKLYDNLNDKQKEAVFAVNGPLLVLAGAGTGKTTVLVTRIAQIINFGNLYCENPRNISQNDIDRLNSVIDLSKNDIRETLRQYAVAPCPAWAVLAITFTNKAANEMKIRLSDAIGDCANDIWAGTFHSICVRILRKNAAAIGYTSSFTIYDADDTKKVISKCMKQLNIDEKMLSVKEVANKISRAKDKLMTCQQFTDQNSQNFRDSRIAAVFELYEQTLKSNNAMDFDDLILKSVFMLKENPDIRNYYASKFKYVCVDEYQDTNTAQFELTSLLSSKFNNLMVVGDDDQSIYKFRGATIENILDFDKKYQDCKVIKLEQNYRSTSNILNAANSVIRNNFGRRGKELWTDSSDGSKIYLRKLQNQNEEGKFIVSTIRDIKCKNSDVKFGDFAVLYRMNSLSNSLENVFSRSGIPYRIVGGLRFNERKEIKDILSYLSIINNPDDSQRLERIINEPKRKIGLSTVNILETLASENAVSIFRIMKNASSYPALIKSSAKLETFAKMIEDLKEFSQYNTLEDLLTRLMEVSGYKEMLLMSNDPEDMERYQNIEEMKSNMIQFEEEYNSYEPDDETEMKLSPLESFLEQNALVSDIDNYDSAADSVVLMTIHSAKGLEFPIVFLPGFEDGIFPGFQSMDKKEEMEEERRLAYVAITRAKNQLYISHTDERMLYGKTQRNPISCFAEEIPEEYLDIIQKKKPEKEPTQHTKRKSFLSNEIKKDAASLINVGRTKGYEIFVVGDNVEHMLFGHGVIVSVKEVGADILYEIMFDNVGTKKLMATYAKLKRA